MLTEEAKVLRNEKLIPEYDENLIKTPEEYLLSIPANAEKEVFCSSCNKIFICEDAAMNITCPMCEKAIIRFEVLDDTM